MLCAMDLRKVRCGALAQGTGVTLGCCRQRCFGGVCRHITPDHLLLPLVLMQLLLMQPTLLLLLTLLLPFLLGTLVAGPATEAGPWSSKRVWPGGERGVLHPLG
jgi:hypothetical protein